MKTKIDGAIAAIAKLVEWVKDMIDEEDPDLDIEGTAHDLALIEDDLAHIKRVRERIRQRVSQR